MKKKYLYNGEYYTEAEMTDFAKQSGLSFDSYISALGKDVKVLDAPYEYKGNFYTQDEISASAKKKGIKEDAYLSQYGIKKKEEAAATGAISSAASKIGGQVGNFVGQSEKDNALSLIQSINAGVAKGIEKGKQQFPNEIRATPEEEAALRDAQRRTGQADGLFTQQGAEQFNLLATDPLRAILDPEREKLQTAYNNRRLQGVRQTSDNTIARNNIDPNKTVQKKDGKLIPDVSSNPEYQVKNQEQALENVSGLVKNKFFKNGKEALEYAENQVKSGIDPTGNETIEHAITKAGEYKQKEESALNGKSIIQNAIEIQLQNDPLFKKQYETIINGTASDAEIADVARRFNIPLDKLKTQGSLPQEVVGELVHRFISDPDIKQIAEDNPEFKKDFDNFTGDKIYEVFPEYADVYIKNTLSRARELDGKNNWFANPIFDKSKYMDNLAEEVFKDRPILLKRVKDKFHNNWEHKIETTGIVDDLATGARGAMSGMWRSLKDVSGFGESYSDRIRNTLKEQYGHVETPHQNEFRKVVGEASNFMGMVLAMGATGSGLGNIGKGLGVMNPSVASKAVTLATFFDDELNHAASIYPENPTKAYLRASLSTAFFLVAGDAIPASKITGFKQNITQTLKSLETKALDKQAKMKLRDKILSVATETLQGTAKGTAEMTVMINGFKLLIDRALGLDESSINNEYSDANLLATAKSMLFGLPVPSMIHGFKGINRTRAAIYEMASNPEKYKSAILKRFGSDDHRIADIDFIADFKKYLDSMRVAENEKAKMVFNALHAKRLREQKSPDAFMKRNHEEEIRAIEQEQQDIMDGKDSDAGLTDSQKAIKTAYENGEINEMMEAQIKEALKDPAKADQFIKEIAEQATGAVAPELGNAKDGAIKFFGETLTDFAIGKSGKKGGGESVVFEYENEGEVPQKLKPLMVKDENGRITITMPKDEADALQKRIAEGLEPDMELMDGTLIKKADIKIKDVQDGRVKYKGEDWSKDVESTAKALEGKTEGLLSKPTDEVRIEDLKNKNFSTFIYNKESDVPEIFKDKITSKGTTNGKTEIRVTLPKSEADYYLNKDNPQAISEAYHKAKADGSNPELVKAVESLLSKEQPTTEPKIEGTDLTNSEAIKFLDDHVVDGPIQKLELHPDFELNSEELERGIRQIRKGEFDKAGAKKVLAKIDEWKRQGYVDYMRGAGKQIQKTSLPFDMTEALAQLPKEQAEAVIQAENELEANTGIDEALKNFTDKDGNLDLAKLSEELKNAKEPNYWGDLLGLNEEELTNLQNIIDNEQSKKATDSASPKSENQNDAKPESNIGKEIAFKHAGQTVKGKIESIDENGNYRVVEKGKGKSPDTKYRVKPSDVISSEQSSTQKFYEDVAGSAPNNQTGRIPVDPIIGGTTKKLSEIIFDLAKNTKQRLFFSKLSRRNSLGTYSPGNSAIKIKFNGDLDVTAHELGHSIDDHFGILSDLVSTPNLPVEQELNKFSPFGSKPPAGHPNPRLYEYGEGFAEFLRAYIVNPKEAKAQAPELTKLYESKTSAEYQKAVTEFSNDIRSWAGSSGRDITLANIEMEPTKKTLIGKILSSQGNNEFVISWVDKLVANFVDPLAAFNKAFEYARTIKDTEVLPADDPRILARLLLGVDGKYGEILQHGMIDGKNNVLKDANGEPKNLEWLLRPLDNTDQSTIKKDMEDVVAYMVSERTVELADKFDRETVLSGVGGGIFKDVDVAKKTLDEFNNGDPNRLARIKEAADRYRELSDDILKYMVDKGRMSKEDYNEIKKNNLQYVAMMRVMESEPNREIQTPVGSGGKLGSKSEPIKKQTGSTKMIENPYSSLIKTLHKAINEADRNEVLRSFRDMLVEDRSMYQDSPKRFSDIGVIGKEGDKNAVTIFIDGKPEHWIFQEDVHNALKGLGAEVYKLPGIITAFPMMLRWSVTHFPVFAARNIARDFQDRIIKSNEGSGMRDVFGDKEHWREIARTGGLNSGYYMKNKESYYGLLEEAMHDISKNTTVFDPIKFKELWRNYTDLLTKSETVNRVAEYRAAFKNAKSKGMDDYNASLYAGYKARDLMDFAVMGEQMKWINQVVPFSNASIQGLRKAAVSAKENPIGFTSRMIAYTVAPSIGLWLLNHRDEETAKQYEAMPWYQRDMAWNFKIGINKWASIPKPYELSLFGSAVDRTLSKVFYGKENAFEGYGGSVANTMLPIDQANLIPVAPSIVEGMMNYDMFRDKSIVPPYENNVDLSLRNTDQASRLGNLLQEASMNLPGGGVDARKIDHFIKGQFSYFGNTLLKASNIGNEKGEQFGLSDLGFFKETPAYNSPDVQKLMEYAEHWRLGSSRTMKEFHRLAKNYFNEKDDAEKENKAEILIDYSKRTLKIWKEKNMDEIKKERAERKKK